MLYPVRHYKIDPATYGKLEEFYQKAGLRPEYRWDCLAVNWENDEIMAAGYREGSILKCIASRPEAKNQGLSAQIVSELVKEAAEHGVFRLFLFTRPANRTRFEGLGFYPVEQTRQALMMENRRDGLERFLRGVQRPQKAPVGCIVIHGNPFTLGHLALVERAASECGQVYLFVLSERTSPFTPEQRLALAHEAVRHLPNVVVEPGGDYIISTGTFPDYFYPNAAAGREANCELDLTLFGRRIAPALGITARYVGEEPFSPVTASYNSAMEKLLPSMGVTVKIIPRAEKLGGPISASRVRQAILNGDYETVRALTPAAEHSLLMEFLK